MISSLLVDRGARQAPGQRDSCVSTHLPASRRAENEKCANARTSMSGGELAHAAARFASPASTIARARANVLSVSPDRTWITTAAPSPMIATRATRLVQRRDYLGNAPYADAGKAGHALTASRYRCSAQLHC